MLVDRYCAALVDDGVEVDRLLAFTFTERAAAELRDADPRRARRAARAPLARRRPRAAPTELLGLARATERAWVMTIHAFCRRLLAAHPLAAGLDPAFRVLDANQAARLRDRAFRDRARRAAGRRRPTRSPAPPPPTEPWRLTAMTIAAHERLRSQGMVRSASCRAVGDPVRPRKPARSPSS